MKVVHVVCALAFLAISQGNVLRRARDLQSSDPELSDDCHDIDGNPISGKPYSYPGDCSKFYQCSNGYRTSQNCAEGTVFNPALSVCDLPENVPSCSDDQATTTETPDVDVHFNDDCVDADGNPISGKPFQNPDDCGSFYQCSNGYRTSQNCAKGTVFNPALSVCDWPQNVPGCGGDQTTTTEAPDNNFIACEHQGTKTLSCPSGSVLHINSAYYGRQSTTECPGKGDDVTGCSASGSEETIENLCEGKQSCVINPDNSVFGDPCYGTVKYVEVDYDCVAPPEQDDCVDADGNPISGKPFQNPDDCGSFYQCSNGYRTSQNCAEGTVFNP